jgi:hypothetical protein
MANNTTQQTIVLQLLLIMCLLLLHRFSMVCIYFNFALLQVLGLVSVCSRPSSGV